MSGSDGRLGPEPEYAPPVDPWAAAEAAHRAAAEAEHRAVLDAPPHPAVPHQATAPGQANHPATPPYPPPNPTMLDQPGPPVGGEPAGTETTGDATTGGETAGEASDDAMAGDAMTDQTAVIPVSNPEAEAGGGRRRSAYRRMVIWGAAAVTVVVVASVAVLVWWPRGAAALDFRALADVRTLAAPESATFLATQVVGDRTYLAGAAPDGPLVMVAVNTATGDEIWRSDAAGIAPRWNRVVGLAGAVVAFGEADSSSDPQRMVVLGADGAKRWERPIGPQDHVLFMGDTVVVAQQAEAQVVGLDLRGRGDVRWTKPNPRDTSGGTATAVFAATTVADFAGPAGADGTPLAPDADDDLRFVQVGADRSAQVFDAQSGKRITQRANVADPDDIVVAHDGRLFVAAAEHGYQIFGYDLAKLGQPEIVYAAPDSSRQLQQLTPCGDNRLCLLDVTNYDATSAEVVAVDTADGGDLWRRAVPEAETLVPVGQSVLVGRGTSPAEVRLLNAGGAPAWDRAGSAVRLDAGNVLLFAKPLPDNAADVSVAGQHVGDEAVQLGPLTGAVTSTCSWSTAVIACAADNGFVLRSFTN